MISTLHAGYDGYEQDPPRSDRAVFAEDAAEAGGFLWERTEQGIRLTKYVGSAAEVVIPAEIDGAPVRILGGHAFYENGMDVERIVTPPSLRIIEAYACEFCMSLTEFVLTEGVEELGREFLIATQIETLRIPSTVRRIEEPAELGLTLEIAADNPWYYTDGTALFRRPEGQTETGDGRPVLDGISLETILPGIELREYAVPEGVTSIAHDAFESQDMLERMSFPKSLLSMDEGVLSNPKSHFAKGRGISKISIADGNPVFFTDESALYQRLPDGGVELVKYLGKKRELMPGSAVHVIGKGAFVKSLLEKITIPETVEKIWPDAFLDCPLREADFQAFGFSLYFPAEHPYVLKQVLEGFGQNERIYDFSFYDRVLTDDALNAEKVKMCIFRLKYPKDLPADTAAGYRRRIGERLAFFTEQLGERQELLTLQWMSELGFFTKENIDALIERLNRAGYREAMAVLMDYKNRVLGNGEFSFAL